MDIKKTDIFSGIGVFIIQMIANAIFYAFKKSHIYLAIGVIFALIVSVLISIIVYLKRKIKDKDTYYSQEIEKLGVENLKKECSELRSVCEDLQEKIFDVEQESDEIQQYVDFFNSKCIYYERMDFINQKIMYLLKHKQRCENDTLQKLIDEIEYIFRDDLHIKEFKLNISVFQSNMDGQYYISVSTRHSQGTISKLRLGNDSLVGAVFSERKTIYCGDINNRKPEIPFVELDKQREYQSILAIPCVLDDKVEFVLVITCTKTDCLEETYKKYQDIIQRYLELLGILISINFDKEKK